MRGRKLIFLAALLLCAFPAFAPQRMQRSRQATFKTTPAAGSSTVIEFDGVDDRITFSSVGTSDNTWTITGWIRPDSFVDGWECIISANGSDGIYLRSSQLLDAYIAGGQYFNNTSLSAATWYHFAFVNNGGSWTWYLNGSSDGTGTGAGVASGMNILGDDGSSETYAGRMSEIAVFSVALSSGDVSSLASKSTTPGTLGNLLLWFKLDDVANGSSGNGVTFSDSSGNALHGTGDDGANNTGLTGRPLNY